MSEILKQILDSNVEEEEVEVEEKECQISISEAFKSCHILTSYLLQQEYKDMTKIKVLNDILTSLNLNKNTIQSKLDNYFNYV